MAASASAMSSQQHEVAPQVRSESKREKKRQLLQDRLQQMSESFARGRDSLYREQLQKIQLDTNLIMRIDPYSERPLDALDDDTRRRLAEERNADRDPAATKTLLEMAGPKFADWVGSIEDIMEERDYEITKQKVRFQF